MEMQNINQADRIARLVLWLWYNKIYSDKIKNNSPFCDI